MVAETTPQSLISSEPEVPFSSSKHHDVPIEHLDYVYIGNCSDVKYIEKLLKVLRSGKEGLFPDLIEFTENRLRLVAPSSKLLNVAQPIKKQEALATEEKQSLVNDLNEFLQEMNCAGNFEGSTEVPPNGDVSFFCNPECRDNVPIRGSNCNISDSFSKCASTAEKSCKGATANRIKSGDYRAWDKFDVDAECDKIEKEEQAKIETNRQEYTGASKLPSYDVNVESVTDEEISRRANIEKEKGNESFRANDFDEAIVYYSRSLQFLETAACLNNRCLAYLKKGQWSTALEDANKVLEVEPSNLKAMLRRSQAYFGLKHFNKARVDVEEVLKLEPTNKNAIKVKADIDKANAPPAPGAKRLLIQDCEDDEEESEEEAELVINDHSNNQNATTGNHGSLTRMLRLGSSMANSETSNVINEELENLGDKNSSTLASDEKCNDIWDSAEVKEEQFFDCSNKTPTPSPPIVPEPVVETRKIPEDVLLHKNLANKYFYKGQFHEAMLEYSNAIDKMAGEDRKYFANAYSALWSNRAACYVKMGDLKQGILDSGEAFKADGNNVKALIRRSNCYAGLERYKEAFVDLTKATTINSSVFTSVQKEYNLYRKYLADELGPQWENKLPEFNSYDLESQQEKYNKLKLEGNNLVKSGRHDSAIELYSECIKTDPNKPVAYANRAQCYMCTSRHSEAKQDCDKALELLASEPDEGLQIKVFYRRCQIQKTLKNYKAALDDLAKVMKERPNIESYSRLFTELMNLHRSQLAQSQSSQATQKDENVKKVSKKLKIVEIDEDDDDEEDDEKPFKVPNKNEISSVSCETGDTKGESSPKTSQCKLSPKEAWKNSADKTADESELFTSTETSSNNPVVPILTTQSPYEFTQAWQSLKGTNDTKVFARLLDQVEDLSKVITVKCDGEMIALLLKVLHDEYSARTADCIRHLESLTKLPRFKVIMMFLQESDKTMVKDLLESFKCNAAADQSLLSRVNSLEKKFLP